MHGRDHARTREERQRRRADAPPLRSEADRLLALQRSAGNHAVGALLARSPDGAPVKEKEKATSGAQATLSGIGTIPLTSVSFGAGRPVTRRRDREEEPPVQEITLTSKVGEHSAKLQRASIEGGAMAVEVTLTRGSSTFRIKLEGALVSSYTTSGAEGEAIESWSLNFTAIEQQVEDEPAE